MTRLVSLFFPCYLTKLAIFFCNLLMKFTFFSGINWWNSRFLHIRLMRFAVLIHEWLTKSVVLFRNHLTKLMIFCNNQFTKIADPPPPPPMTDWHIYFSAIDWQNSRFFLQLTDEICTFSFNCQTKIAALFGERVTKLTGFFRDGFYEVCDLIEEIPDFFSWAIDKLILQKSGNK